MNTENKLENLSHTEFLTKFKADLEAELGSYLMGLPVTLSVNYSFGPDVTIEVRLDLNIEVLNKVYHIRQIIPVAEYRDFGVIIASTTAWNIESELENTFKDIVIEISKLPAKDKKDNE